MTKNLFRKIANSKAWLFFTVILVSIMTIGAFYSSRTKNLFYAFLLLLPVSLFVWLLLWKKKSEGRLVAEDGQPNSWVNRSVFGSILLYYSLVFSAVVTVGGYMTASRPQEWFGSFLFLPVTVFMWAIFFAKGKNPNGLGGKLTDAVLGKVAEAANNRQRQKQQMSQQSKQAYSIDQLSKKGSADNDDGQIIPE